jgi:EmrB/QacA subfamily drug resistance transporter
LAAFVVNLDTTIVNVALPTLVRELHATTSQLQWIVDAYNLVFAALVLAAGSVSDRVGRKGMLLVGLAIFALGSVAGGLVSSPTALIAARCVMGLGAAVIFPATLSLIANVFTERRERALAIGLWGAMAGLGVAFGPIVGGFLLEHFNWPSIFFALAPVAAITAALAAPTVPTSRDPKAPRADPPGLALSSAGMALLIFTIIEAPGHGWGSARTITGFVIAAGLLVAFISWERRAREPMIDVGLFGNPRFTAASGSVTIAFFSLSGYIFLITQYFQFLKGYSPLSTGVRLLPVAASVAITSVAGTKLAVRVGTKLVVAVGSLSLAGGLVWTASASTSTHYLEIVGVMVLVGAGIGLTSAPATEAILGVVPKEKAGIGSAINDATRVLGGTLGVAVIGSVYASLYASRLTARLPAALPTPLAHVAHDSVGAALIVAGRLAHAGLPGIAAGVHDAASSAFFHGFRAGVIVAAAVSVAGAAIAGFVLPAQPVTPAAEQERQPGDATAVPVPISMLICIAGCQSTSAAVHHHHRHHRRRNGRAEALQRFYGSLFGWRTMPIGDGYGVVAPADGAHALDAREFADVPVLEGVEVTMYVRTADLRRALGQVDDLGGRRVVGPIKAPDGRTLAVIRDPEGQLVGLFEPSEKSG